MTIGVRDPRCEERYHPRRLQRGRRLHPEPGLGEEPAAGPRIHLAHPRPHGHHGNQHTRRIRQVRQGRGEQQEPEPPKKSTGFDIWAFNCF